jgi:hypothetical protein
MDIDVSKLAKVLTLLRKNGIKSAEIDGLKLEFGELPPSNYKKRKQSKDQLQINEPQLTDDEMLFWSSQTPGTN